MQQKLLAVLATGILVFGMTCVAQASLTTIGTATYLGSDYNLIWDDDNNGNSVVWLDYSNSVQTWSFQTAWAAGLGTAISNINTPGYNVTWDSSWRLPSTVDGPWVYGYDGTTTSGYNITTSEMGHLFYTELNNLGYYDTSGNVQSGYGLSNTGDFNNLIASVYWFGTEHADGPVNAWNFTMGLGYQDYYLKGNPTFGLALRSGQVSAVPVPGAIWLLGSGLTGLVSLGRRRKGNCV